MAQLALLLIAGLAAGSPGCNVPATGGAADAAPGSPDAALGSPDAAPGSPDAASGSPDAAPGSPDAEVAPVVFPGETWEQRTPEQLGMNSAKLDEFASAIGGAGVVIKDGYLVKSWGAPNSEIMWASASKPVISTMLFFAIHEGRLNSVDDPLANLGHWGFTAADQSMTYRHLANMTSGYARAEVPGAAWAYNDYAIKLYLRTMFSLVFTDGSADAAIRHADRLGALQFEDGAVFENWMGYSDLLMTSPRDFARIGWFWLNRGRWQDRQLLPRAYFDNYMRPDIPGNLPTTNGSDNDYLGVGTYGGPSDQTPYGPGIYGFNWWFNAAVGQTGQLTWPDAPADTFQANGHWNAEICTIIPSLGLVVAAQGAWDRGQNRFAPGDPSWGMNVNLALLAEAAGAE